jgi:hypothetical protein
MHIHANEKYVRFCHVDLRSGYLVGVEP